MTKPRLRFAPSPTGYLHIGGARTALFNWLWARKTGGSFILRIEDTDQERSTEASRAAIFESMTWLGLDWDEGPSEHTGGPDRGAHGPYTQMQRLPLYAEWSEKLIRSGKAYRCYCTKTELDAQREALKRAEPTAGFKYPGTCRDRTDQPDRPYVVRFKTERTGSITYVDKVFGEVVTPNIELQDFVLMRSDGVPLYNFGAVVDDITMDVTVVARGRDHMINTPPQILLYQAFDAAVPEFAHLPMMLAASGEKLSKRHGAVSVTEYRDNGYSPAAVLDYLARFGWSSGEHEVRLSRDELVAAFDWAQCGRGDGKFDPKKFVAINHDHLKSSHLTPNDEYTQRALPFLAARGLASATADGVTRAIPSIRERAQTFVQAADLLDPLFRDPPTMDDKAAKKFLVLAAAPRLRALRHVLTESSSWNATDLEAQISIWLEESNLELKDIGQPVRVALTGRSASPSLFEVLELLGRDVALARLERAARIAETSGPS
jgi:glutamyl-tRNA synthetase